MKPRVATQNSRGPPKTLDLLITPMPIHEDLQTVLVGQITVSARKSKGEYHGYDL